MGVAQNILLHLVRAFGGFSLARHITRKRLRILCYHGFSVGDEFKTLPFVFMRPETFERRMKILKRRAMPVISLDAAMDQLRRGHIANAETVITLDDGWASNLTAALPVLEKYGFPACVYVTTEHLEAGVEAFNVALYYMICKSQNTTLTITNVHPQVDGEYDLTDRLAATSRIIETTESALSLSHRQAILPSLAHLLGLSFDDVFREGRFTFLTADEMKILSRRGIAVQLHTHTHRLPASSFEEMAPEITANRKALEAITEKPARHFCYPSGVHNPVQLAWLEQLGVESATTCDPGLNSATTSPMLLKRFLDSEDIPDISFEAEICGVREILRAARRRLQRA